MLGIRNILIWVSPCGLHDLTAQGVDDFGHALLRFVERELPVVAIEQGESQLAVVLTAHFEQGQLGHAIRLAADALRAVAVNGVLEALLGRYRHNGHAGDLRVVLAKDAVNDTIGKDHKATALGKEVANGIAQIEPFCLGQCILLHSKKSGRRRSGQRA